MKLIRNICVLMVVLMVLVGCSNDESLVVPDISGQEVSDMKNILSSMGLIPNIEYQFSTTYSDGAIISVTPKIGEKIEKNGKVNIIVSKGSDLIEAQDAIVSWHNIGDAEDEWSFEAPYIKAAEKNMIITIYANLGTDYVLKKGSVESEGFGQAVINDPYDKVVPITVKTINGLNIQRGKETRLSLIIPVGDLDSSKPTDFSVDLYGASNTTITLNFTVSW